MVKVTVNPDTEATKVLEGIPVPVTAKPTTTRELGARRLTTALPLLVILERVKYPLIGPTKGEVFIVLSISVRFCPAWARRRLLPEPETSKKVSNCQRLLSLGVKPYIRKSDIPVPIPTLLMGKTCKPLLYPENI